MWGIILSVLKCLGIFSVIAFVIAIIWVIYVYCRNDEEDGYSAENFEKPKKKLKPYSRIPDAGFARAVREITENEKSVDVELIKAAESMKQMSSGEL